MYGFHVEVLVYMRTIALTIVLAGTDDIDVGAFLYTYENNFMRTKNGYH